MLGVQSVLFPEVPLIESFERVSCQTPDVLSHEMDFVSLSGTLTLVALLGWLRQGTLVPAERKHFLVPSKALELPPK